ncbi:NACHT domain-containing protein [Gelidibacter pelagius]|uniref:NACHT domain-containing protein n=1 Tax=Gelidibacter pelagius TaxID=2819985 RepID=A0ABS3SPN4_9FLAO|nr:hypothetical protein [Gelidibacter pelagius]MBO3097609.1 hypothetical protein [Gelidibacter pelagius]
MSKETLTNKTFKNVKDKLEYIQKECNETELFGDLSVLFKNKGFQNVKITHGNKEYGKDLVFSKYDETFEEDKWYAVIVKNKPARQNDFMVGGEIANQILQAINKPYRTPKGEEKNVSGLFIVINGNVTENSTDMLVEFVSKIILPNIKIYDYQDLRNQIEEYSKESFLDNIEPSLSIFVKEQTKILSDISLSNSIFDLKLNDINEIFINVQTTYTRELKKINNYVTFDESDKKYKEEDVEGSNEILNSNKNFIIHGIPTSGKTLFLKRIGLKALCEDTIKQNAVFYFDLQNHTRNGLEIKLLIDEQFSKLTKGEVFKEEEFNKVIILFDSIDFIKDDSIKINILKSIEKISKENEKFQIILATRNYNFIKGEKILTEFKDTELLPFNFGQALSLVKRIIPNDKLKTNHFLSALKSSMLNTSLQRTPLSLTLLAILYRDDKIDLKELPANIFSLYDLFTDVYLDKWDATKGITQLYKYEQTKNILAFIAFQLHEKGSNSILEDDLKLFLLELRKDYNYDELNNIEDFVEHLKSKNGVFNYDNSNKSFYFFNHYFQEYFASLCIEDDADSILIDNFFNDWWSNSIVFYCGKKPRSNRLHHEINSKIIPIGSRQKAMYLVNHSKCLQASHSISISNREMVVRKLIFEFNNLFISILEESQNNSESLFNKMPFVTILNYSKNLFDDIFSSKHIATSETIKIFEEILLDYENDLSEITIYNIAYFLAFLNHTAFPFEVSGNRLKNNIVWNRILFVDINLLKLKKKIDEKQFIRIKRRMNKNKFLIQNLLNNSYLEMSKNKK